MFNTSDDDRGGLCVQGLSETLFERLQGMYGDDISEMLTVQYRMHARIMQWSSDELYGGRLTAHASVAEHTLADLKVSCSGHIHFGTWTAIHTGTNCHGAVPPLIVQCKPS